MFLCEWWKRKKSRSTESNQNQLDSLDEHFIDVTADNNSVENNSNENSNKSMFT